MLFVTFFLELGSRQLYNAALPQIKVDFAHLGTTDTQLGVVGTVFSAVFGLCLVASGIAAAIAKKRGMKKMSAQAVGGAVGWNPICIIIPCHRVVGANGALVGYGGGIKNKVALLAHERSVRRCA